MRQRWSRRIAAYSANGRMSCRVNWRLLR